MLSALIIGSMAPDFEYLLRLSTGYRFSHTLPGVCLFCVPVGLTTLWIFHHLLKLPLLSLLPLTHQQRLLPFAKTFRFGPWSRFGLIVLSLVLGALTHLLWDACTHEESTILSYLPLLRTPLLHNAEADPLKPVDLLQHGSSLFGAAVIIYWYRLWIVRSVPQPGRLLVEISHRGKVVLLLAMALGAGAVAIIYSLGVYPFSLLAYAGVSDQLRSLLHQAILAYLLTLSLELVLFSICWHLVAAQEWRRVPDHEVLVAKR